MPQSSNYQELARRYGLAAIPESVVRLTQLVARQDADLGEVARVIAKDPAVRIRLLRVANVEVEEGQSEVDAVESALMRNGMGCALLLAMGTPLALALVRTFQTMLGLKLESVAPNVAPPLEGTHVLGTIGFAGKAVGRVHLHLSLASAKVVGARILGLEPKDLSDASEINDAVGELLNIIAGNFKSNLCDAGLDCRLETPQVSRTIQVYTTPVPGGGLERMAFQAPEVVLFVDVTVNPWNEE
jgi:chemotaxis protein CheX